MIARCPSTAYEYLSQLLALDSLLSEEQRLSILVSEIVLHPRRLRNVQIQEEVLCCRRFQSPSNGQCSGLFIESHCDVTNGCLQRKVTAHLRFYCSIQINAVNVNTLFSR